jgi:uncharacterized protein (TIGR00730 family)
MKQICVFCGSNAGNKPIYADAARQVGAALARRKLVLVYGGGQIGLMGIVADATLAAGGEVIGVIPRALATKELAHTGLTELRVVGTMHERKALMAELSDGFIALPGAFGTLDEFCEILTWAQLGLHANPCGILDVGGYFDPLLEQFDRAVAEGLLKAEHRGLVLRSSNADDLLDQFERFKPPNIEKWIEKEDR